MSEIKVSIVITTRNRIDDLTACIESIATANLNELCFEIIVVDDASTDATKDLDPRKLAIKNLTIIRNSSQSMMVKTRNKGAKQAKGELVLFVDDDNVIDKGMIMHLVQFADQHPEYGVIGPQMCYHPSQRPYLSYQLINLFTGKTSGILENSSREFFESDGIPNVFMVRRNTLEKCGYFDESIVQTYTEPDLAFAARRLGFKCAMLSQAITYHRIPEGGGAIQLGGNQFRQKAFFLMRNRTVMVARYGSILQQMVYFSFFVWAWPVLYSILVLREKRFDLIGLYWSGHFSGLKYFFTRRLDPSDVVIARLQRLGL